MKAIAHDLFSVGVGIYFVYRVWQPQPTLLVLLLAIWLALATNEVIDVLGHFERGGLPIRSFWTHSIFTAPLWGIVVAFGSIYLVEAITGSVMATTWILLLVGLGVVMAYSHLLLDAFTEGGIYLGGRRIALAHLRYNNPVLNAAFAALGVLLIFVTFV